ncbi:MAG: S8 family serine peptidase [Desulfurococcales archaeon]|nr:S8 family serine peptidase [Desulfurococcales archaeon]
MESRTWVPVAILLLVILGTLHPLGALASSSPTTQAGQYEAVVDPEVYAITNSTLDVLIVGRPLPPAYLDGLPRQVALRALKQWANASLGGLVHLVESLGGRVYRTFWIVPAVSASIPRSAIQALARQPGVSEIILNTRKFHVSGALRPLQQGPASGDPVVINWGVEAVNATTAWRMGYTGLGVRIAVLDTGVDPSHPALAGKLLTLVPGDPKYPGGWIAFDDEGRPECLIAQDTYGHGTFVASEALGGNTNTTIVGVAPEAQLMAALVLPQGSGTAAQVLAGFEWAADPYTCTGNETGMPPNVVVFSAGWEGYTGSFLLDAIRALLKLGVIVVASIGNYGPGQTQYPGNVWGVYGVGAVNQSLQVAPFSSGGTVAWASPPSDWPFKPPYPQHYIKPDFVAPGVNVGGAVPGGSYAYGNGTSFAAPHVAGVAALVLQALGAEDFKSPVEGVSLPELVYDILANTSLDLGPQGLDPRYGWGLVNATAAVELAVRVAMRIPVNVTAQPRTVHVGDEVNVTIKPLKTPIPSGAQFRVYLDNTLVATARAANGTATASFTVPQVPMGAHTILVESPDGFRGNTTIQVKPSLLIKPQAAKPDSTVLVEALGMAPNTTYTITLDGFKAALLATNTTGSGLTSLPVPASATPGLHLVQALAPNGAVAATASLSVVARERLEVEIATAPTYHGTAIVYILTSLEGEPVDATLEAYILNTSSGALTPLQCTRLARGLYAAELNLTSQYTLLIINATYTGEGAEASGVAAALLYNDSLTPQAIEELRALARNETLIIKGLQGQQATLQELLGNATQILSRLASLEDRTEAIDTTLQNLQAAAAHALSRLDELAANTSVTSEKLDRLLESQSNTTRSIEALRSLIGEANSTIIIAIQSSSEAVQSLMQAEAASIRENTTREINSSTQRLAQMIDETSNTLQSIIESSYKSLSDQIASSTTKLGRHIDASIHAAVLSLNSTLTRMYYRVQASIQESYDSLKRQLQSIALKLTTIEEALSSLKDMITHGMPQETNTPSTTTQSRSTSESTTTAGRTATTLVAGAGAVIAALLALAYYLLLAKKRLTPPT